MKAGLTLFMICVATRSSKEDEEDKFKNIKA